MKPIKLFAVLMLCCCSGPLTVAGQVSPEVIRECSRSSRINTYGLNAVSAVREFYERRQFRAAWINNPSPRAQLLAALDGSANLGLNYTDYQPALISSLKQNLWQPVDQEDSLKMEFALTDAALHFFNDIAYGNAIPEISYNGLAYQPNCHNIPELLADAIDKGALLSLPQSLEPISIEYFSLKNKIIKYLEIAGTPAFIDVVVTISSVNPDNSNLIRRMWQLGILDSVPAQIPGAVLKSKVKELQRLFNLPPDGILKPAALKELNIPLQVRIAELRVALNTIRWLNCVKSTGSAIVVNIPSATLLVYENGHVVLESRIVVGKKNTRTPTLTSKVTEVVLYPYWNVPKSIATKELLPLIKKNPGYLRMNRMQVINERGKVLNPANIDWNALSPANFPYVLRQSTGCDNSLGLVKLNFYNPYHVYLHDTPWKALFAANKRYFSHGCMRVERAMELAHLILGENTIAVDTLEDKGCLLNQSPVAVPASLQMPVFVLYNTAWTDSSANVSFNEDIYGRFQYLRKKPAAH